MKLKCIWQAVVLFLSLAAAAHAAPVLSSSAGILGGSSPAFFNQQSQDGLGLFGATDASLEGASVSMAFSFQRTNTQIFVEPDTSTLLLRGDATPLFLTLTVGNSTREFALFGSFVHVIVAGATLQNPMNSVDTLYQDAGGRSSDGYYVQFAQRMLSTTAFENHELNTSAYLTHTRRPRIDQSNFDLMISDPNGPFTVLTGFLNVMSFDGTAVDPDPEPPVPVPAPATGALMLLALCALRGVHAARRKTQQR